MTKQLLVTLTLLVGLAMASGLVIAYSRTEAAIDRELPEPVETVEVSFDWQTALQEEIPQADATARVTSPEPNPAAHDQANQALLNLPLRFIANAGQTNSAVRFTVKGAGHTIFFTPEEVVFSAVQEAEDETEAGPGKLGEHSLVRSVVRLRFASANPDPTIKGLELMPGIVNYFLGNDPAKWQVNVPTYEAVAYRNLYPGISLIYRGTEGRLKSEFRLAPRADPALIQMVYEGVEEAYLRQDGALVLETPLGELIETAPLIYQEVDGVRREISGGYVLQEDGRVGFEVAAYDPALPLVIDPELAYASYLGGSVSECGEEIAVDGDGNVYVTGWVESSDFPTTTSGVQIAYGGGRDAFVTQIANAGGVYTYGYSAYLGGSGYDWGKGIAVDDAGNAYVTGRTTSSDFPTTSNAAQPAYGGGSDVFVTKIVSASGVYTYGYSTYLGGSGDECGEDIAVDGTGTAYVTGWTQSSDFPTTTNAIQPSIGGAPSPDTDAFVTKIISASGVYTYGYSSYLGGHDMEHGLGIAVDGAGSAYVTGKVCSLDFPTFKPIQPNIGGYPSDIDAFVTKIISASGAYSYGYSTYLGGGAEDYGHGIAVDGAGSAYVTGETWSGDFPTTTNAIQATHANTNTSDAIVTKIIYASGVYTYGYSTYLGGSSSDYGYGIAVDDADNAYVTGETDSSDFPTRNVVQTFQGGSDVFVTKIITASGVYTYGYSTCLGGSGGDHGWGIAVDDASNAYVTGQTDSSNFPTTTNAIQPSRGDSYPWYHDAFVAKISLGGLGLGKTVAPTGTIAPGQAVTYTLVYANESLTTAVGVLITDVVPAVLINVSFTSSGAQITPTGSVSYTWQVEDLSPGEGGLITITGVVSPSVSGVFSLTNRATITATNISSVDPYLDNNASDASGTVDAEPPLRPALTSPADGAAINDTTPALTWQASPSPDTAGYLLDWNGAVVDMGAATQYTPGPLADGGYTWTVAAYDALGNTSAYTDVWSLTVDTTPPALPTLLSPANGTVTNDTTPTLTWQASPSPDTAGYLLDWNGAVVDMGAATQYTPGPLADGSYTWTVAAYDAAGNSSIYTGTWSLTVDATPPEIRATTPISKGADVAIDAAVVITFSEPVVPGAFAYTVTPDPGGWVVSWDGSGMAAMLIHNPFACWATYTVTVTAADDLAGNPLSGAPYAWRFTTAPRRVYLPLVLRNY